MTQPPTQRSKVQCRLGHRRLTFAMQVILHDAKTHRSRWVVQALAGEAVVIARAAVACKGAQATISADHKVDFKAEIEEIFHGPSTISCVASAFG